MNAIQVLRGCGASGVMLEAGRTYAVPGEVSESDASLLIRMGKAVGVNLPGDQATTLSPAEKTPRRKKG